MSGEHVSEYPTTPFSAEEVLSIRLLEDVPAPRRAQLRDFLLGPELNLEQKKVLAADAADPQSDFNQLLETAEAWRAATLARSRNPQHEAAPTSATDFLAQLAQEAQEPHVPTEPPTDSGPQTAEASAAKPVVVEPQANRAELHISAMPPHFQEFRKVLAAEVARYNQHAVEGHGGDYLGSISNSSEYRDGEPLAQVFQASMSPKAKAPYLGDEAISKGLAEGILRSLRGTQRGQSINFPREFQATEFTNLLQEHTFDRPRPNGVARIQKFRTNELQLPMSLISSVRLVHKVGGRLVELSDEQQPRNPRELFMAVFQSPLPEPVFEVLVHEGRFSQSQHLRVPVDSATIGPLQNGRLGVELKLALPTRIADLDTFARLGAGFVGSNKLITLRVTHPVVY